VIGFISPGVQVLANCVASCGGHWSNSPVRPSFRISAWDFTPVGLGPRMSISHLVASIQGSDSTYASGFLAPLETLGHLVTLDPRQ
jgi:hypothetical protein